VTSIPVNAGLFGEKIKKISDDELEDVIKVELNLPRDPNFYSYTDSMLKEALDREINSQETPGLTFGSFILNALYEEKLVEMCYPHFINKKSSEFFSKLADNLGDWQNNFASQITKLAILGAVQALGMPTLGIGISTLFLAINLSEIHVSIAELEETACNYKLFLYLNDRYQGNSHEIAFAEMDLPLLWSDKKKQATENFFDSLWEKYEKAILSNDLAGFREEQHEMLRELILQALDQLYVTEEEVETIPATATALVIDHSGSMGSEKKLQKAQEAARCYIDSISEEEWASIAAFSSSGHTVVELLPIKTGRERLKQGVFSLSAATNTNIGAGLEVGLNQLFSAKKEPKEPIILLLSDGMHNTGKLWPWVEECKRKQVKVYTVAFGSDADQVTLCKIAHQTGGRCFPAGLKNLSHVYHKANIYVHNNSTLFASSDWLKPGQELKYKVDVPSDFRNLTFFTNWQGSSVQTVIVKPDGSLIYPSSQMGDYQKGNTYSIFRVPAETGIWELRLSGRDLPQEGEQINVSISGKSETYSNFLTFQPEYKQGQRVLIRVEVADVAGNQKIPLENIKVKAKIEGPTPQLLKKVGKGKFEINPFKILMGLILKQQKIDLYDDGVHDDYDSKDGIYGGTFLGGDIPGPYLVTAIIEGQSQGKIISRQIQESFQI
ncbi:MAG: VWA domain-containing protein, partial [Acidobacteriota bacterium]|nr:VWA domain-containing protein [Acidobacteriota bacterium]